MTHLVESYQQILYWYIRKMVLSHDDSKDILQEVFLRTYRKLDGFKGDSSLSTWLYRIATNEVLRFLEKKKRNKSQQENLFEVFNRELENSLWISDDEIQLKLQRAILKLPDKQRLVFNMRYFDDLDYEVMSAILKTSVNTLKVNYHLAKTKIEEIIREEIE
jgi:RNA polymerase sigma-70 factor (ECF subfamily)